MSGGEKSGIINNIVNVDINNVRRGSGVKSANTKGQGM